MKSKASKAVQSKATERTTTAKQPEAGPSSKKRKLQDTSTDGSKDSSSKPVRKRHRLGTSRPWPSVPGSSNATGPRSARADGNNKFLISRKVELAVYLRKLKECVLKEGYVTWCTAQESWTEPVVDGRYKTLYITAVSAAIPHMLLLATSFPEILPYHKDDIKIDYRTGTVLSMDEIEPDSDDDTFGELVERKNSSLSATITIGDGLREVTGDKTGKGKKGRRGSQSSVPHNGKDMAN